MRRTGVRLLLCAAVMGIAACSGAGESTSTSRPEPPFEVAKTELTFEPANPIAVWSPLVDGSWPVVFALHGLGGTHNDLAPIAAELASQGTVVFAPFYRSNEPKDRGRDLDCGYQFALDVADEYGGDLDQPITFVGYSLGATMVLWGGLGSDPTEDSSYDGCLSESWPRPDAIVAIAGCHYQFEDKTFDFDPSGWTNHESTIVVVAGDRDTVCEPWQSDEATDALQSAGYDAKLVTVPEAGHAGLVMRVTHNGAKPVIQAILQAINAARN